MASRSAILPGPGIAKDFLGTSGCKNLPAARLQPRQRAAPHTARGMHGFEALAAPCPARNSESFVIYIAAQHRVAGTLSEGKTSKFAHFLCKSSCFRQFQVFSHPKPALEPAAPLRRTRSAIQAKLDSSNSCQLTDTETRTHETE